MRFDTKNPYQMNYPDFGGFDLGHAIGNLVSGLGHNAGPLVNAVASGDTAATANTLAAVTTDAIGVPGTHTGLALLTGQDPIEAAKRDMSSFQNAANVAANVAGGNLSNIAGALQNGTALQVFNAATNLGKLKDTSLPVPPGGMWARNALDVTGMGGAARRRALAAGHPIMALHARNPLLAEEAGRYAHYFHHNLGSYPVAPPNPPVQPPAAAVGTVPGTSPTDGQLAQHAPHKKRPMWEWLALAAGGAAVVAGGAHLVKKHHRA